jgi:hypothetical protein
VDRTTDREDLFEPALTGRQEQAPQVRPWRLGSQVYVAFFGGPLAVGGIGAFNAGILRMPRPAIAGIVAAALLAEAAFLVVYAVAGLEDSGRIASTVAGLVAFGPIFLIQRSADRVYHFHTREDEPYQGLFGPGLIAVICGRIVEYALVSGVGGG